MAETEPTPTRWLLFDGDRLGIAVLLLIAVFLSLVLLGALGLIDTADSGAVRGVATAFVPGLIAFLSIVLGINQLVLSQELGSASEIRDRIEGVREYRHDIEDLAGTRPSPVLPIGFLTFVVGTLQSEAVALRERVEATDPEVADAVSAFARHVVEETDRAEGSLDRLRPGRINALLPVLEYDNSGQLYEARRLLSDHEDALSAETEDALESLIESLELFGVARTQFRTTYTQRVLARLSRQLLYVGLPALLVVVVLGLTSASSSLLGGGTVGLVAVSALLSVALSPLAVLASYLLRVAAVSERTISPGPFVSRPGETPTRAATRGERPSEGNDDASTDGNA